MSQVTKVDWTIQTANAWWSGTDTQINLDLYRDNDLLQATRLEPGNTPRLDRNSLATYYWQFKDPSGLGVSVSGTAVPYSVRFPQGVAGHLRVRLTAKGDDAWEKLWIRSNVYTGALRYIAGTIDSLEWVEDRQTFNFTQDVVLSTDASEGFTSWTLQY